MSTEPPLVDDEAVAEALLIFLEHERFSRSEAMRKVLIWARQHFCAPRSTTFGTYVRLGSGGGVRGVRGSASGRGDDGGVSVPPWAPLSTGS